MKLYLVRHGQTPFNKDGRHQFPDTPLSTEGLKQAEFVGKRFKSIAIDIIVASTYTRALQTASAIKNATGKELITSELLIERKNPSVYQGKVKDDPEIRIIKKTIREKEDDPTWHHSDEENFTDVETRSVRALEFLSGLGHESIVAVTHGFFLSRLVCTMLFGENITPALYNSFGKHTRYSNTGITMCEYNNGKWEVLTWNDYAHLGE